MGSYRTTGEPTESCSTIRGGKKEPQEEEEVENNGGVSEMQPKQESGQGKTGERIRRMDSSSEEDRFDS
jgi:hypothetical protein